MSDVVQQKPASPHSSRTEHVAALIETMTDQIHVRLLRAYREKQTVEGAEAELGRILEEIIDEA
jgi:hypothetical protein